MQKRKVIIVGGGLAGLLAAYELTQTGGFDIHLIEKNTYLGGRVHTCTVNEQVIDIGGFLIYPWYKHYHNLIERLGLTEELVKIPLAGDYYAYNHNSHEEYDKGFTLSFREIVEIFIEIFPIPLTDSDPTCPELHAYHDLTIQEYITSLYLPAIKKDFYLSVFDTYLQGYCYGSVTEVKMTFMAATIFQNTRHGDLHSASYLQNGSKVFIDALQQALESNEVKIYLNCMLEGTRDKQLSTSNGIMQADDIIFCHTPEEVKYTRFITATILYSGTALIKDDDDWGSCFYKEDAQKKFAILSIVNVKKLYNKKVAQYLNLNIKVNDHALPPISSNELFDIIVKELPTHFKGIKVLEIVNRIDWEKAMPIASESFVESIRLKQGKDNFYYAGDFMGCPAMETALMSGKRAAQQLISVQYIIKSKNKNMKTLIGIYASHDDAVRAIAYLKSNGYDTTKISLISKANLANDQINLKSSDLIEKTEIGIGIAIGAILGLLTGAGVFLIPGIGILYGAGAVTGIMAGIETGLIGSGIAVILTELGIENAKSPKYEEYINEGKYLVLIQGNKDEVEKARETLHTLGLHLELG
jgi:hypothetical protein